ncbi:MAG: hypothetical protein V1789_06095 [PVC group bacterium]
MDKKKKEIIIIGILIPVLGFILYNSLSTVAKKKKAPPRGTTEEAPVKAPVKVNVTGSAPGELPPLDENLLGIQRTIAEGPWERDPFRPPPVKENKRGPEDWKDFKLTGIIPGRAAIINSEPVGVGEEFEGYLLKNVETYRIMLEKDGQTYILALPEDFK